MVHVSVFDVDESHDFTEDLDEANPYPKQNELRKISQSKKIL